MSTRKRTAFTDVPLPKRAKYTPITATRRITPRRITAYKESGFVDTVGATYGLDTTGSITHLSIIPQGASVNQRVGKRVALKSLQFRGFAANQSTAAYNDCAMLIVYDKRPTGSLPAITDILETANATAMNNDNGTGRFQIIKRADFELIGNNTNITSKTAVSADFWLDLKNKPWVAKDTGTGVIADVDEGAVYLVTVGSNPAGGSTAAGLTGQFRLRYIDM